MVFTTSDGNRVWFRSLNVTHVIELHPITCERMGIAKGGCCIYTKDHAEIYVRDPLDAILAAIEGRLDE